jgi:hypothetical protein
VVADLDTPGETAFDGRLLLEQGLPVSIKTRPGAVSSLTSERRADGRE